MSLQKQDYVFFVWAIKLVLAPQSFRPSLISLVVSVDVKPHVYFTFANLPFVFAAPKVKSWLQRARGLLLKTQIFSCKRSFVRSLDLFKAELSPKRNWPGTHTCENTVSYTRRMSCFLFCFVFIYFCLNRLLYIHTACLTPSYN